MKLCKAAKAMGRPPCMYPENCPLAECELRPEEEAELKQLDGTIWIHTGQQVIEERETAHGDYHLQATFAQALKQEFHQHEGWKKLNYEQRESLDMIAVKISRILNGNPNDADHWRDIAGYATLTTNLLTKGTHL